MTSGLPCLVTIWMRGGFYLVIRARNIPVFRLAKKVPEATSGPSIWHDGKKESGRYFDFRPLENQKSL